MNDETNNNSTQESARYTQAQEREDQRRRLREEEAVRKAFTDGPQFKISPQQVLQGIGTITFNADGEPLSAGKKLSDWLIDYARVNPHAVASGIAEIHDTGKSSVRSKADLTSVKDKVAFIRAHGQDTFARLPATAPQALDESTLTLESFHKLPVRVKTQLIVKHSGSDFIARLPRR